MAVFLMWAEILATETFPLSAAPLLLRSSLQGQDHAQQLTRQPIRAGGNVQASKLIRRVEPVYPPLAQRARISAPVILQVTFNEEGVPVDIQVLRGHPLLDQAAVDAVR